MPTATYQTRRSQLLDYFDRTAVDAWARLTTDAPVSGIRATVRAGREEMRNTLLGWLPDDLSGRRLLDAGCGTGALAIEAAQRGARVVAIDVAANLIEVARRRAERESVAGAIDFRVGDMLADGPAEVDYVVAMDSLIHYTPRDVLEMVRQFATRAGRSVLFTSAPWTPALGTMHFVGRLIPHRSHRAPAIEPVRTRELMDDLNRALGRDGWRAERTERVTSGFYISQAIAVHRTCGD